MLVFDTCSARKSAVKSPVITQSGLVLSPGPVTGSLLLIETMRHTGDASQLSVAETLIVTGTILPLAGKRTLGLAFRELITGGVVSATVNVVVQVLRLPAASVTMIVITCMPGPTSVPAVGL